MDDKKLQELLQAMLLIRAQIEDLKVIKAATYMETIEELVLDQDNLIDSFIDLFPILKDQEELPF